ncbi:MAG: sn-glycerol-3-phosphate ABC transporter permease UgpE [Hyphomicrobiaceae bacterium]|nr:sn-glycerol-3-phosphate ABC transporter permease UgpE [Hyphomicrobiaceae bacterium]
MVENRPWLTFFSHAVLVAGVILVVLPIWVTFVASTHRAEDLMTAPIPMWPGSQFFHNYASVFSSGIVNPAAGGVSVGRMMMNSLIMALTVAIGKIAISFIAAFAIVYFRFRFRMLVFWTIFITLMLPVEVRILPTFKVVSDLGMLNSYAGLSIPLIASATATFLFRQFFLSVPDEIAEAARIDGAGPLRFLKDILFPLSRTNLAALFVIMFTFGWNQYLWPLLMTTDKQYLTIVMGIQRMINVADTDPQWPMVMASVILALLPPVIVVVVMQKLFVKGLVEIEK